MRRHTLPLLILTLALAAQPSAQPGRAQAPGLTPILPAATYRIAGTIVSASDNHPLQRATVELRTSENRSPFQTTTSDEFGHFAFTAVPAGKFGLEGSAHNYLAASYDEHDGFSTAIVTGAGLDTESLVLKLRPQGTLAGTIVDEASEPVQNANVRLFRQSHASGQSRFVAAGGANTNDLGRFEISRLAPGTYYLAVTASPWYAVHPNPQLQQQPRNPIFGFADSVDPTLDVAYPITFYPGTIDPAAAAPIVIRGGDEASVDLQLTPQPAVTLTLPRTLPQPAQQELSRLPGAMPQPQFPPQLRTMIFGQLQPVVGQQIFQTATQTIISGIAPGDYYLADPRASNQASGATPLHLADRNTDAAVPESANLVHVHVLVKLAGSGAVPSNLVVSLRQGGGTAFGGRPLNDKGEADLDVPAGDYFFFVAGQTRYSVSQVSAGDKPLPSNNIHAAAGDKPSFTLTVVAGTHTVQAIAKKDGKPFPGAFILLFPADEATGIRTYQRQQSDLDGSFDLRNLAPGDYALLAIDGGWDLDWQRPEVLAKYLPAAVAVHIAETGPKVQILPEPVPVQPR